MCIMYVYLHVCVFVAEKGYRTVCMLKVSSRKPVMVREVEKSVR